jgi:hypothetical protein
VTRLAVLFLGATLAFAESYSYWIEPCPWGKSICQPYDPQLAEWALKAWQNAAEGALVVQRVEEMRRAQLRVYWFSPEQGMYGETRPLQVDGKPGAAIYVTPARLGTDGDLLLRDVIVYLTCLHETGHALGLPHTAAFDDIMYNFQFGGDITEYFARYRRKLRTREDIRKNSGLSEADRKHLLQAESERK